MADELRLNGTVKTTAVVVNTGTSPIPASPLPDRKRVIIFNGGTASIYLGGADVSSTTGITLGTANPTFVLPLELSNAQIYATGVGSATVRVMEIS